MIDPGIEKRKGLKGETMVRMAMDYNQIVAFCGKWRIAEFSLFGSVLRDDFGPESDVDVLVSFESGAPWSLWDLIDMREELARIFGRRVDLVEEKALRNPFRRREILTTRQVIHAA
ncbi:MAG: nucleotidyltransferase family protein [Planctomycetota bacterium]